jgi:hypothetical protein
MKLSELQIKKIKKAVENLSEEQLNEMSLFRIDRDRVILDVNFMFKFQYDIAQFTDEDIKLIN